jgi:hypothetical protein
LRNINQKKSRSNVLHQWKEGAKTILTIKDTDMLKNRIRWKVYNGEIKEINQCGIGGINFKFRLTDNQELVKFSDFINSKDDLSPMNLYEFFRQNNIKFSVRPRYVKGIGLSKNIRIHVLFLLYASKIKTYA